MSILIPTIIILLALGLLRTRIRASISRELIATTKSFSREQAKPDQRILFVGDSTAVGVGASDPQKSTAGYMAIDLPRASVYNCSRTGARIADIPGLLARALPGPYDLVVLQIGGNDIIRMTKFKELRSDIVAALDIIVSLQPTQVIVLTSGNMGLAPIFHRPLNWLYTIRTRKLRKIFIEMTKTYGFDYLDFYTNRWKNPFAKNPKKYYARDGFHPSDDGYAIWHQYIKARADLFKQS